MSFEHFSELTPEALDIDEVLAQYEDIIKALDEAQGTEATLAVVKRWDGLRDRLSTWSSLIHLRFSQDTADAARKADRDVVDAARPRLTDMDVRIKRKLLDPARRAAVEEAFGTQVTSLWSCDVSAFDPAIQDDLVTEARLGAKYTELRASARLEFQGQTHTLSSIGKFAVDPDRQIRHESSRVKWAWFEANGDALDGIFDEMVGVRHRMARQLGYEDFVGLGYRWMQRVDYDRQDVENFRRQVREHLVPLTTELARRQADRLGVERLMYWDEGVLDPEGSPSPKGDIPWIIEQSRTMFHDLGPETARFIDLMIDKGLLDLEARQSKAGGGFCTSFPDHGTPFIFANFNGTMSDIRTYVHELGHAFQCWTSRDAPISDYHWPTYESCEIHSMSLEFLSWPFMERFFGQDIERFKEAHLTFALTFIPYGVAVDHFQHLVYENPDASPADRHAMWQQMEELYLPSRDYGDLTYPARGGVWQQQLHIYGSPFYYIDYTLAQTCALQFWSQSLNDHAGAMDAYVKLCRRGGDAPFQALARSAGLISPFEDGCLVDVVKHAASALHV